MEIDKDLISRVLGATVVVIWLVALLPQVAINFRRRSASGLSPILIIFWFFGDACGLLGAFLTHQLAFQKVNCVWHFTVDSVLALQWYWFHSEDSKRIQIEDKREDEIYVQEQIKHRERRLSLEQALALHSDTDTPMYVSRERPEIMGPRAPLLPPLLARTKEERRAKFRKGRRTQAAMGALTVVFIFLTVVVTLKLTTHLLDAWPTPPSRQTVHLFGRTLAWLCASLYIGSRLPQIYHNYSRKSCQGLSLTLFLLASLANVAYCGSVLLSRNAKVGSGEWNKPYLLEEAPFLVTAAGALCFDQIIMWQWCWYRGWTQPSPRDRLDPILESRQTVVNHGSNVASEAPTPRVPSASTSLGEREPLLTTT